jgi:hypothetical protein
MTSTPVQRRPSAQKRMSVALQEGVAANTESLTALGLKGECCRALKLQQTNLDVLQLDQRNHCASIACWKPSEEVRRRRDLKLPLSSSGLTVVSRYRRLGCHPTAAQRCT